MALFPRSLRRILPAVLLAGLFLGGRARADEATPIPGWMRYEQKLLSRQLDETKILALGNKQDARFAPEQGKTFLIKSYWIDADQLDAFSGEGMPHATRRLFFRDDRGTPQVRLLVHPESERFYAKLVRGAARGDDFLASSTASSRTLLAWPKGDPKGAFFAKLSLDKEIGGVVRTIPRGEVARSIGVNNVLHADREALPASFKFLPEVLGVMPRDMERGGMIIRAIPDEVTEGKTEYVPLFSLYAPAEGGGPPLLARMIQKSGLSTDDFIKTRLIRPFIKQWLALAIGRGIVSEVHAQNVLLELGKDGLPTGTFVHRDFGGFNIDLAYRDEAKLPMPRSLPVIESLALDYHQAHHDSALDQSLHTYFTGGFLYNLDREIPKWQEAGWLKAPGWRWRSSSARYSKLMVEELEHEYVKLTGRSMKLGKDLRVAAQIRSARSAVGKRSGRTTRP